MDKLNHLYINQQSKHNVLIVYNNIKIWRLQTGVKYVPYFEPYLGNQSFFAHAVFCNWFVTLRRFFWQHLYNIVRAVFSQKSKKHCFYCFWALFAPKWGIRSFWGKSGSVTFFHLYSPNFMQKIRKILRANSEKNVLRTDGRTDGLTDLIS